MPLETLKPKVFSGTSKIFDGTLERVLNEIIGAVNDGDGGENGGGTPVSEKPEVVALDPVTEDDATDEATAVALANANKAAINAIIAALQA